MGLGKEMTFHINIPIFSYPSALYVSSLVKFEMSLDPMSPFLLGTSAYEESNRKFSDLKWNSHFFCAGLIGSTGSLTGSVHLN